jgi:hypothetical protein
MAAVAGLYDVSPGELARKVLLAAREARDDPEDPIRALPGAVSRALDRTPATPTHIRFFHGTRTSKPQRFMRTGLRPLGQVLDSLWPEVGALVPELSPEQLAVLRADLWDGKIGRRTYSLRVKDIPYDGPCGHLVRDMFLHPHDYASVDYLAGAEIVIDICEAIEERAGIDVTARYRRMTTACVVEFSVATSVATRDFDSTLSAALWYLAAGLRGERTIDANWSYCADNVAVAPEAIVSVLSLDELRAESHQPR